MKNFKSLSKAEMRKVMGGMTQCGSDIDCPGDQCCSEHGFCGTTADYCGGFGSCTVTLECSNGSVQCSSIKGRCYKGNYYVQCDADPKIYC